MDTVLNLDPGCSSQWISPVKDQISQSPDPHDGFMAFHQWHHGGIMGICPGIFMECWSAPVSGNKTKQSPKHNNNTVNNMYIYIICMYVLYNIYTYIYINIYVYVLCITYIYIYIYMYLFFVLYLYQNWIYNTGCCFPPLQPQSSPWCHDSPRAISCSPGRNSEMKELGHQWSLDIYSQLPSWSRNVLEKRRLKVTDVVLGHLWWQTPEVTGKSEVVWSYD